MASNLIVKIENEITDAIKEVGVSLYDIEYIKEGKNQVLRIYIDKDDGVSIDECEKVSRALGERLDQKNIIEVQYNLEVSSPGVERKLKTDCHFKKVVGKEIDITLYAPIDKCKNFSGILKSIQDKSIELEINGVLQEFEKEKISSAKLHFDINEYLKNQI